MRSQSSTQRNQSYLQFSGQILDNLKWFVPNTNYTKLNNLSIEKAVEVGQISKKDLAKELHLSRTMLYQPTAPVAREIRERLIHIAIISDCAYELYKGDKKKTMEWVMCANQLFFGRSPFEMALAGKAESVLAKLHEWLGSEESKS